MRPTRKPFADPFTPAKHLPKALRRRIQRGKKLGTPKLAYRALYSAIRAQDYITTYEVQFSSLCYKFGRYTAKRLITAAQIAAIRWNEELD